MPALRRTLAAFAAFAVSLALTTPARAVDYTDIWWARCAAGDSCDSTGHKNGSGVNLVQNEDVVFATFYISDPTKKPIWVSSDMHLTPGGTYVGNLYYSTGSFFGGPWNSSDFTATTAGTATFTPTTATTGILTYSVSGVPGIPTSSVTWTIDRFTFRTIVLAGSYVGGQSGTISGCSDNSKNGPYTDTYDLTVAHDTVAGFATFSFHYPNFSCVLSGTLQQEGQLYSVPSATYTCTGGGSTSASMSEIKATSLGIEGRFTAPNLGNGCREDAIFSAVLN